jgi:hypothetical protein
MSPLFWSVPVSGHDLTCGLDGGTLMGVVEVGSGWTPKGVLFLISLALFFGFLFFGVPSCIELVKKRELAAAKQELAPDLSDRTFFSKLSEAFHHYEEQIVVSSEITTGGQCKIIVLDTTSPGGWHESGDLGAFAADRAQKTLFELVTFVGNRLSRIQSIEFTYSVKDSNNRVAIYKIAFTPTTEYLGVNDPQKFKSLAARHIAIVEDTCSGKVLKHFTR